MKPVRKRFDRNLHDQNDMPAKDSLNKLLENSEYKIVPNSKKTGVDLFLFKDGKHMLNIECEVKRVWVTKEFPYESIQIASRKGKYLGADKPTIFVMFNKDHSSYLVIKDKDLAASPLKEVPNKYVWKGEFFYQVPKDKVSFNDITGVIDEILD